ncbi:MAG: hypothetical protein D6681_02375 [Calditrichaeota bacterium]|nr:MAG: hypothetical protein D6681_02375 [Calditrichota bacterium]
MKRFPWMVPLACLALLSFLAQSCLQATHRSTVGRDSYVASITRDTYPSKASKGYSTPPAAYPVGAGQGALRYRELIRQKAARYNVDYYLLLAIVQAESGGNPRAVSQDNCRGLTQLHIRTAREYMPTVTPEQLHDPEINLEIAARHMKRVRMLVRKYFPHAGLEQRVVLIAAAWNAGWSRVRNAGGVPNLYETKVFTRRVLQYYRKYRWG